jgi:DNA topoisomerase-3
MLILCEKPSVAREFAKTLHCEPEKGLYRNTAVTITYCLGHLYELWNPDDYRPEWKKWDTKSLPILPETFRYKKKPGTESQAGIVSSLLRKHGNDVIIIATDAGREGELIGRIALREAGLRDISKCRRFWVSQVLTENVIRQGLSEAKPLSEYNAVAEQGFARQHADWIVGINLSRYMSCGNREIFSVGRVQSAVLSAVYTRNYHTANFIPVPYQELEAAFTDDSGSSIKARLVNPETNKTAFPPKSRYTAQAAAYGKNNPADIRAQARTIRKTDKPEKLLNITGLQKQAYKLFGYNPEKTLDLAQALYEKHKCLSYPRTPSRVMGDDNVDLFLHIFERLKTVFPEWSQYSDMRLITAQNKHIFNSAALEDHHALIPLAPLPEDSDEAERNVFGVVARSFFTVCMNDCRWNEKQICFINGDFLYRASIREMIQEGWKASLKSEERGGDETPEVKKFNEQGCTITSICMLDKATSPRKEFSIDTLLAFMENPHHETEDGGRLSGLGTPATRADILKTLFERNYLENRNKKLFATQKGIFLLEQLGKDESLKKIADVAQTTEWEKQLESDPGAFETSIVAYIGSCVQQERRETWEGESYGLCPLCGNKMREGRKSWYCSGYKASPPCGYAIWKETAGTRLSSTDVRLLLAKKETGVKTCVSRKSGKEFKASLKLGNEGNIEFVFKNGRKGVKKGGRHEK